jgi:hypothetical protein
VESEGGAIRRPTSQFFGIIRPVLRSARYRAAERSRDGCGVHKLGPGEDLGDLLADRVYEPYALVIAPAAPGGGAARDMDTAARDDVVEVALAAAVALHRVEAELERRDPLRAVGATDRGVDGALDGERARLDQLRPLVDPVERGQVGDFARVGDGDQLDELLASCGAFGPFAAAEPSAGQQLKRSGALETAGMSKSSSPPEGWTVASTVGAA